MRYSQLVPTRVLTFLFASTSVLAASSAAAAAAAASDEDGADLYRYAGECVVLHDRWTDRYVSTSSHGYSTERYLRQATPFRMQATALGRYLLYGPKGRMPASSSRDRVAPTASADPTADWSLSGAEDALRLTNLASGLSLAVDWRGRLRQSRWSNRRWRFEPAEGCAEFPEIEVNVDGTPFHGLDLDDEVQGYLDAHVHLTAFEFLGGRFHCGRPWSPYGVADAQRDCPDHWPDGRFAVAENLLSTGNLAGTHSISGWPDFDGWPRHDSLTHEGTYWKGIERAWRGGLRIMVTHLVENRALCELYFLKKNSCEDMASLRLQAQALYKLQDYIDAQFKGPGKGFFRIVKSPQEARAVIADGKLAVVIGVETSQPFDCLLKDGVEICSREQIDRGLQELSDLGVRSLFPVHKFDNAFGGTTMDGGTSGILVNLGNRYQTGRWWQVGPCPGAESDRTPLSLAPGADAPLLEVAASNGHLKSFSDELTAPVESDGLPTYPSGPVCNTRGLTDLGEYLVRRMVDMGMILETDHLSVRARDRVLDILEESGYSGVISSHSWGGPVSRQRIQALGGVVAPYANSTRTFIAEWADVRSTKSPDFLWGIGYGADTNGLGMQAAPRGDAQSNAPVIYPFVSAMGNTIVNQSRWGNRLWDFNVDGASHYGLFIDWIEDIGNLAGPDAVADLARGAEAYLQMWERAVPPTP